MIHDPDYPELNHLIGAYLNEDCALLGNTLQEIIECYKSECPAEDVRRLLDEAETFRRRNPRNLDQAFRRTYGSQFGPERWGRTTSSFFEELRRLLQ